MNLHTYPVTPAKAGVQFGRNGAQKRRFWTPAFAGVTVAV